MRTRAAFPKPLIHYKRLEFFGANVIASESDEWHHHGKGAAPALGERNDALVYEEANWVVLDLFDMWKAEGQRDMVAGGNMADLTFGGHYSCGLRLRNHVAV